MFNIERPEEVPASLTQEHPEYNSHEVLEALNEMSYSKCYICETKQPTALAVEHFDADGDRFDWDNLLLACHRCNSNIKGSKFNNLLNPCDKNTDVVTAIRHVMPNGPNSNIVITSTITDSKAQQTIELLDRVFNADDTANRALTRSFLRRKLFEIGSKFYKHIFIYCSEDSTPEKKKDAEQEIIHFLRCGQEFSAFLRWIILDDHDLRPEFEQYIPVLPAVEESTVG